MPGSAAQILRTLEALNLFWDGEVTYQSARLERYQAALEQLCRGGHTFECSCSRQALSAQGDRGYPGTCRQGPRAAGPTATRFRVPEAEWVEFSDRLQGPQRQRLGELGDVVIRRRDGLFAYQLAVVVDDAEQNITDIVRGADLIESTAWQIKLQRALGYGMPRYAHLPLVTGADGGKLAKSRHALPAQVSQPAQVLYTALLLLQQHPPQALAGLEPGEVLDWAVSHWNPAALQGCAAVPAPA